MAEETPTTEEVAEVQEVKEEVTENTGMVAPQPAEEPVNEQEPAPKPKKNVQERINEITRLRREAEREAEYWKAKATKPEPAQPERQTKPPETGRPDPQAFESVTEYEDALLEWHDSRRAIREQEKAAKSEEERVWADFEKRSSKVRAEHPDFDDVLANEVFSPAMMETLLRSEDGPEVAYFLGRFENHDRAKEIERMPAALQAYELGKLGYEIKIAKATKKTTTAPDPITPVGITGSSVVDESKMSDDEWFKREQEKRRAKIMEKFK